MAIDIGRIAYAAYSQVISINKPKWEALGKEGQDAWRAAAVAVLQHIDEQREEKARHGSFERDIID